MVGSAIKRKIESEGYTNLAIRPSTQLDLRNQQAVDDFFAKEKPEYVFMAAAKVGGIMANSTYKAQFIYDNLMIEANVIHAAFRHNTNKLFFLGSSCIYPKLSAQPIKEEFLLTGLLEPSNEPYAIAKIAGIKLCDAYRSQYGCNFISAMPCNLYGLNDNYDLQNSHVIPALIRKFHEAKKNNSPQVEIWGTGNPLREFLFVDDLADAIYFLMGRYEESGHINIGSGKDLTIRELAEKIQMITGYQGAIKFDITKPDGTPRKLLDISKLGGLGWNPFTPLEEGLKKAYADFIKLHG